MSNPENNKAPAGLLSPADAAEYLGVSAKFLATLRCSGGGPRYALLSSRMVRYRRADLDAWLSERLRNSTFAAANA